MDILQAGPEWEVWILTSWGTVLLPFTSRLCDSISLSHSFLNRQVRITQRANLVVLWERTESTSTPGPVFDALVGCYNAVRCMLRRISAPFLFHPRRRSPFCTRNNFSYAVFKYTSYSASGFLENKMLSFFTFLLMNLFSSARELAANGLPIIDIILFPCRLHS